MKPEITDFAKSRHWDPNFTGTLVSVSPEEFIATLPDTPFLTTPGYADFCQKWTYQNQWGILNPVAKITPENEKFLRSGYRARREGELPVLTRWFEGLAKPLAQIVTLVVYNKEQLAKEGTEINADWGVVAVLAADTLSDSPMTPCTIIRNHLGVDFGGSGHPIDVDYYNVSVDFWSTHAIVK